MNTIGSIPEGVPYPPEYLLNSYQNKLAILRPVLDRYVRHGLRRSESEIDHEKAELVTQRLRMLGTQITETGIRPCASPVGRIMAYASSKTEAISTILSSDQIYVIDSGKVIANGNHAQLLKHSSVYKN